MTWNAKSKRTNSRRRSSPALTSGRPLPEKFFARGAEAVARGLLGKVLVRRWRGKELRAVITETEAYLGPHDLASHSSKGLTPRTAVMFGPPGRWYVYFTYGMHWLLNIVTGREGRAVAVLIRGLDAVNGPARITRAWHIDRALNAKPASRRSGLWVEDAGRRIGKIETAARIGVAYAGPVWSRKHLRFFLSA